MKRITIILLILALLSSPVFLKTTKNYIDATNAADGLRFEVSGVKLEEGEKTFITIRFAVKNPSPLFLTEDHIVISVYLNGRFLGIADSYEPHRLPPCESEIVIKSLIHPLYVPQI